MVKVSNKNNLNNTLECFSEITEQEKPYRCVKSQSDLFTIDKLGGTTEAVFRPYWINTAFIFKERMGIYGLQK